MALPTNSKPAFSRRRLLAAGAGSSLAARMAPVAPRRLRCSLRCLDPSTDCCSAPRHRMGRGTALGNGALGALVWGDGAPLRISLDRADLWDLRPVAEFHSPEYRYETMQQWHREGKVKDLLRLYEEPYNRPAPTKIPAGRIELTLDPTPQFVETGLSLADAVASMRFAGGAEVEVLRARGRAGRSDQDPQGPGGIAASDRPCLRRQVKRRAVDQVKTASLSQLGYEPPVQSSGPGLAGLHPERRRGLSLCRLRRVAAARRGLGSRVVCGLEL